MIKFCGFGSTVCYVHFEQFFFHPNKCIKCVLTKACHDLVVNWSFLLKLDCDALRYSGLFRTKQYITITGFLRSRTLMKNFNIFFHNKLLFPNFNVFFIIYVGFFFQWDNAGTFLTRKDHCASKGRGFLK